MIATISAADSTGLTLSALDGIPIRDRWNHNDLVWLDGHMTPYRSFRHGTHESTVTNTRIMVIIHNLVASGLQPCEPSTGSGRQMAEMLRSALTQSENLHGDLHPA
jgi:hypothetical protein